MVSFLLRVMLSLPIGLARGSDSGRRKGWGERRLHVPKAWVIPVSCSWLSLKSRLLLLPSKGEMEAIMPFHCFPRQLGEESDIRGERML